MTLPPPPRPPPFPYTTLFRSPSTFTPNTVKLSAIPAKVDGHQAIRMNRTASAIMMPRSEEHTSEVQSRLQLVCRLLLEKKKYKVDAGGLGVCKAGADEAGVAD